MTKGLDGFYLTGPIFGSCETAEAEPLVGGRGDETATPVDTFICNDCMLEKLQCDIRSFKSHNVEYQKRLMIDASA